MYIIYAFKHKTKNKNSNNTKYIYIYFFHFYIIVDNTYVVHYHSNQYNNHIQQQHYPFDYHNQHITTIYLLGLHFSLQTLYKFHLELDLQIYYNATINIVNSSLFQ